MEDQRGHEAGISVAVWLLEEFDRSTGACRGRHRLPGLSDAEVRSWLGLKQLDGDLYDVPAQGLIAISHRYGIPVFPQQVEYLLGRGVDPV